MSFSIIYICNIHIITRHSLRENMRKIDSKASRVKKNPKIDVNNPIQVDTLAKLFNCEFEDVIEACKKSNGTFIGVFDVITGKKSI